MTTSRVTKRSVDAHRCEPGKDRSILWDDAIVGFGVAAYPTGHKVYIAQFRKDGRSRRAKIGTYGRMTPDELCASLLEMLKADWSGGNTAGEVTLRVVVKKRQGSDV